MKTCCLSCSTTLGLCYYSTHHISSVWAHAVLDSLHPAIRERHAVAAGHHARLAGLLLSEVQALVIRHSVAVSIKKILNKGKNSLTLGGHIM